VVITLTLDDIDFFAAAFYQLAEETLIHVAKNEADPNLKANQPP
jgi:hypothetical protein